MNGYGAKQAASDVVRVGVTVGTAGTPTSNAEL
jgi:hypothetical protein